MPIPATPSYLGTDFPDASPGLRFNTLLSIWEKQTWNRANSKCPNIPISPHHVKQMQALNERQSVMQQTLDASEVLVIEAESVSPFSTGLGIEHPLENGFSFISPYGLPYLPGSGVKGVVRRAAEELAMGGWNDIHDCSWQSDSSESGDLSPIDILFGIEDPTARRGVLSFWDVIPQISKGPLPFEIMSPHQSKYYQGKDSPHECADPTPIFFLTVPPGSRFVFHAVCNQERLKALAPKLATDRKWQELLIATFQYAFEWLGFGAKTSVGYGMLMEDPHIVSEKKRKLEKAEAETKKLKELEEENARIRDEEARYAALPESRRMLVDAEKAFDLCKQGGQYVVSAIKDSANRQAKRLVGAAPGWGDREEREKAASLLESYYDFAGWYEPKKNKMQKTKQESKKRAAIHRIRQGE